MDDIIRVLIVDDHAIVREGLTAMLETMPGIQVIGEAAEGEDAVAKALSLKPDVILMDLLMPRKDGISATKEIIMNFAPGGAARQVPLRLRRWRG